jgi:S-adenosylmethionine decarboxylase
MEQPTAHFGEHLTLDGYGGDFALLNDKDRVWKVLSELPNLLGMDKLAEPVVYFAQGNDHKDPGGWTGVVVIKESHISIHTFPAREFVSADVYTCKNGMDNDFIKTYFTRTFKLKELETHFIKRGTRYPTHNVVETSIHRGYATVR